MPENGYIIGIPYNMVIIKFKHSTSVNNLHVLYLYGFADFFACYFNIKLDEIFCTQKIQTSETLASRFSLGRWRPIIFAVSTSLCCQHG